MGLTYTCPTQRCNLEWRWVILSDLEKFQTTRSVARPLCDNWLLCFISRLNLTTSLMGKTHRNFAVIFGVQEMWWKSLRMDILLVLTEYKKAGRADRHRAIDCAIYSVTRPKRPAARADRRTALLIERLS